MKKMLKLILALPQGFLAFLIGLASAAAFLWKWVANFYQIYKIAQTSNIAPSTRKVPIGEPDSQGVSQVQVDPDVIEDDPDGVDSELKISVSGEGELHRKTTDDGSTQALIDKLEEEIQNIDKQ